MSTQIFPQATKLLKPPSTIILTVKSYCRKSQFRLIFVLSNDMVRHGDPSQNSRLYELSRSTRTPPPRTPPPHRTRHAHRQPPRPASGFPTGPCLKFPQPQTLSLPRRPRSRPRVAKYHHRPASPSRSNRRAVRPDPRQRPHRDRPRSLPLRGHGRGPHPALGHHRNHPGLRLPSA